jgi:propanediol utilization protein
MKIPVVVQHRHVHLSPEDAKTLLGDSMESERLISHKGQFLATASVSVIGERGTFDRVRVLGPERAHTQVELSASDAFAIGIDVPARVSGDLVRSGSCLLKTVHGEVQATSSTIISARHLHCSDRVAKQLGLTHHEVVSLKTESGEQIDHVIVRTHPTFVLEFHLTKDEAAEYWLHSGDLVTIV